MGAAAGWPVATCLFAERLRKLGKYTLADVLCANFETRSMRLMTALATATICGSYLISQIVGAGTLVQILFNIPYGLAVLLVGFLMTVYVIVGGMVATTWIQIVKASVLITTATVMVILVLDRFDFSPAALVDAAAQTRVDPRTFLQSGSLLNGPFDGLGLALAFALGPAGMPHILMRFFTVRDAPSARKSLVIGTVVIATFQMLVVVLGIASVAIVSGDANALGAQGTVLGGANMAAIHLARNLGGNVLFGIVAATVFATILAVVSGLTLAIASAVSHDIYRSVFRSGRKEGGDRGELKVSRWTTVVIGILTIAAGLVFRDQNIGFLATLPLVLAASCNFPILLLTLYWRGLGARGAVAGAATGLCLSILLVVLGPKVWVGVLGHAAPVVPFDYPTVVAMAVALLVAWQVSVRYDRNSDIRRRGP
jgi:cation/acetate symporter